MLMLTRKSSRQPAQVDSKKIKLDPVIRSDENAHGIIQPPNSVIRLPNANVSSSPSSSGLTSAESKAGKQQIVEKLMGVHPRVIVCPDSANAKLTAVMKMKLQDQQAQLIDNYIKSSTFDVERIVDKRLEPNGTTQYLIKWAGYTGDENTWEPQEHLPKILVEKFEKKKAQEIAREKELNAIATKTKDESLGNNRKIVKSKKPSNWYKEMDKCSLVTILKEAELFSTNQTPAPTSEEENAFQICENNKGIASESKTDGDEPKTTKDDLLPEVAEGSRIRIDKGIGIQRSQIVEANLNFNNNGQNRPVHNFQQESVTITMMGMGERLRSKMPPVKSGIQGIKGLETEENVIGRPLKKIIGCTSHCGQIIFIVVFQDKNEPVFVKASLMNIAHPEEAARLYEARLTWLRREQSQIEALVLDVEKAKKGCEIKD